ncbi:hypothetical protein [Trueperella sp.]|uniref:hypothetical protein n=1 Tax=Trueperella sp. TaxID=2699835 RepID=UPI0037355022
MVTDDGVRLGSLMTMTPMAMFPILDDTTVIEVQRRAMMSGQQIVYLDEGGRPLNAAMLKAFEAVISGMVYEDLNENAVYDDGEHELSGVRVLLYQSADGSDVLVGETVTASPYQFVVTDPGSYFITIDPTTIPGFGGTTTPLRQEVGVTENGSVSTGLDFGVQLVTQGGPATGDAPATDDEPHGDQPAAGQRGDSDGAAGAGGSADRSGDVVASGDSLAYTGAANAELISGSDHACPRRHDRGSPRATRIATPKCQDFLARGRPDIGNFPHGDLLAQERRGTNQYRAFRVIACYLATR